MESAEEPQPHQAAIEEAMSRLHMDLRALFICTLQYGEVGAEADLRAHLATGDGLTSAQLHVVIATLNDALRACGDTFRISPPGVLPRSTSPVEGQPTGG